jgi:dihydroxyacetone synthase
MRACGFNIIDVEDGCFDIEGLVQALNQARASTDKPTFIHVRTIIGLGSAVAHGAALGAADVANMKKAYNFDTEQHFVISDEVRKFFEDIPSRGQELVQSWDKLVQQYESKHPELAAEFKQRREGRLPETWKDLIPTTFPDAPTASRKASGLILNPIAEKVKSFVVGTADLTPSVNMAWKGKIDFQHVGSVQSAILPCTNNSTARLEDNMRHQW